MIDWNRVRELQEEIGADAFPEVVEMFLEESEEVVDRLTAAQRDNLQEDLHFLKGSAMSIGFSDLAELCQSGETLSSTGQGAEVDLNAIVQGYFTAKDLFLRDLPAQTGP